MPATTPTGPNPHSLARPSCPASHRASAGGPGRRAGLARESRFGSPGNSSRNTVRNGPGDGGGNTRKVVGFADAYFEAAVFRLHLVRLAAPCFAPMARPNRVRSDATGRTYPVRLVAVCGCARIHRCAAARMHLAGVPQNQAAVAGRVPGHSPIDGEVARVPWLACIVAVSAVWGGGCIPLPTRAARACPDKASHGRRAAIRCCRAARPSASGGRIRDAPAVRFPLHLCIRPCIRASRRYS